MTLTLSTNPISPTTAAGESGLKPGVRSQPPPTPMSSEARHPMWLDEGHREHGALHEKAKSPAVPGAGTWCHRASCEKLLFQVSNKDACQQITAQDSSEGCGVGPRSSPADTMPATGYILQEQLDTKGWGGGAAAWGFWHQDQ